MDFIKIEAVNFHFPFLSFWTLLQHNQNFMILDNPIKHVESEHSSLHGLGIGLITPSFLYTQPLDLAQNLYHCLASRKLETSPGTKCLVNMDILVPILYPKGYMFE